MSFLGDAFGGCLFRESLKRLGGGGGGGGGGLMIFKTAVMED